MFGVAEAGSMVSSTQALDPIRSGVDVPESGGIYMRPQHPYTVHTATA